MEDTTIEDTLKTVEAFYQKQDFANAIQTLQTHKADISPGLWNYNMGTIQAGMKNWPWARYYLLKAEKEGFSSKELLQNLELVESNLDSGRLEKPLSTQDYLIRGAQLGSQGIFTSLALLILVAGLFNLRHEKTVKSVGALVGVVIVILGFNWWVRMWPMSMVMKPQQIQSGPSIIFTGQDEIPAGVLVLTKNSDEWTEIIYPSRFSGWIKKESLKELK